ncbi:hypothetical protein TR51_21835 [Kitasatospora griseola]|uniref:Uncharacterized protein n=1 Tax=Kitasatospora griseola TaxID=2064 RepID=A0A0D0PTC0_KITGR|nr:hypothetical protein TR51_21835 [Kitasatospora griseola]
MATGRPGRRDGGVHLERADHRVLGGAPVQQARLFAGTAYPDRFAAAPRETARRFTAAGG